MEAGKIILILLILLLLALAFFLLKTRIPDLRFFIENLNGSAVILLLLLIAVILVLLFRVLLGPKGESSLFHEKESAFDRGNAENAVDTSETEGNEAGFSLIPEISPDGEGEAVLLITVTEDTVQAGETYFEDMEAFREAVLSVAGEKCRICLVDHYARADRYHEVERILTDCGIDFSRTER